MIVALGMIGCGTNVKVTGKISRSGVPVNAMKGTHVDVGFHPVADGPTGGKKPAGPDFYGANVASDGSFEVPGVEGDGIPPGRYRVSVVLRAGRDRDRGKKKGRPDDPDRDLFNGAFSSDSSPIVRQIESSRAILIDLDRPEP